MWGGEVFDRRGAAAPTPRRSVWMIGTGDRGCAAGPESAQARLGSDARRRRLAAKSRKRCVGLAPDLPLLFPAAGAHEHESDVARDVKPCLYVVLSVVAAHLVPSYWWDVSAG